MALKEYVGAVVFEVDGREFEVLDLDVKIDTGNKLVKTMNRKGKALGFCRGVKTYVINFTVAIPKEEPDDIDWEEVEGAKLTIEPIADGGQRVSYLDCVITEIGEKYDAENEARRTGTLLALDRIKE